MEAVHWKFMLQARRHVLESARQADTIPWEGREEKGQPLQEVGGSQPLIRHTPQKHSCKVALMHSAAHDVQHCGILFSKHSLPGWQSHSSRQAPFTFSSVAAF